MASEAASSPSVQEALNRYVKSLKAGEAADKAKPKGKSQAGAAAKTMDPKALYMFARHFAGREIRSLTPNEIGAYAERENGNGNTPGASERLQAVKDFLSYANKSEGMTDENLARYVRFRKPSARLEAVSVSKDAQSRELTAEGHAQLQAQLERLQSESETLAQDIQRARADGDVTENSPLDAVREEKGRVDARVQEIKATLENAVVIDAAQARAAGQVSIGSRVKVANLESGDESAYTLVDSSEANPLEKRISSDSPMGTQLLGKKADDVVEVVTPRGTMSYRIAEIS